MTTFADSTVDRRGSAASPTPGVGRQVPPRRESLPRNNSTSLRRALRVLDAVSVHRGPACGISLTSLAASLGMSKSTVLRLIGPLRDDELIHQDRDSGCYRLGPAAARLGAAFVERVDVRVLAVDLLRDLSRRTGGSVVLVVRDDQPPGRTAAASVLALGSWRDELSSAASRAAASVRERGWCVEIDETGKGPATLAAPVLDHRSRVVAAVESTLPTAVPLRRTGIAPLPGTSQMGRLLPGQLLPGRPPAAGQCAIGEAVRECADALSGRLGAPRPRPDQQNRTM